MVTGKEPPPIHQSLDATIIWNSKKHRLYQVTVRFNKKGWNKNQGLEYLILNKVTFNNVQRET